MNSEDMRKKIAEVRWMGLVDFSDEVDQEIRKLNRNGLRSFLKPFLKVAKLGARYSQLLLQPVFDFTKFDSTEKHGAIIRQQVTLLIGTNEESVFLVKVLDNEEVRSDQNNRHGFHAHKRVECKHGDHLSYTVGLKDRLLIFVAQIFGQTHHFIYSIARGKELPVPELYRSIFH